MNDTQTTHMDLGTQKDAIAFEMQALFDDYKSGDPHARVKLEGMIQRFGDVLGGKDVLRMRLEQDYEQNK